MFRKAPFTYAHRNAKYTLPDIGNCFIDICHDLCLTEPLQQLPQYCITVSKCTSPVIQIIPFQEKMLFTETVKTILDFSILNGSHFVRSQ